MMEPVEETEATRFNPAEGSPATANQMAAVMLLHGTPEQQREALSGEKRTTDTLSPCPFCGGPATAEIEHNGVGCYWVICDNVKDGCGCEGPYRHTPEDAVEAWNRRAPSPMREINDGA